MGDLNEKLMNEIQYLSRLIDDHKSQAANKHYRQSSSFSQFHTNNTHPNVYRRRNTLKLSTNHVQNRLFKKSTNPYKIDRTGNFLPKQTFSSSNKSTTRGKTFIIPTKSSVSNSVVKSEYKTSTKLKDFIQCSPIVITIQDQSKSISVGPPSDKVKVFKNDTKELPNISVTKNNNRLLQIKQPSQLLSNVNTGSRLLPEKSKLLINTEKLLQSKTLNKLSENSNISTNSNSKLFQMKSNIFTDRGSLPVSTNNRTSEIKTLSKFSEKSNMPICANKVYSLRKTFKNRQENTILKTKYKVVNCRKLDTMKNDNWKHTIKRKQKTNTIYQRRRNYVSSPWKLVYRNQQRISGKCLKTLNWINHHWKNPYYNQHKYYSKRNTLHLKRWRKLFLASRRRKYTGTIAQQVKKNPVLKSRMVMIGGLLYNVSKTKLSRASKLTQNKLMPISQTKHKTLLICGIRYQMDSTGKVLKRLPNQPVHKVSYMNTPRKNLKRIDLGGDTYIQTKPGILMKTSSSQARTFVNRVVNRSIYHVLAADQKKSRIKNNLYCMFYNRFGRCNKGQLCPYKHDPDKIAVCTRFLRGTCKVVDCPFSHKVAPEKMPVCLFYLQGRCNNDNCPYRHVKVNRSAEVCKDFLRGYCPVGQKCKKTHTLVCPDYLHNGSCKNGDKCPMKHSTKKGQKRKLDEAETQPTKKISGEIGGKDESNQTSSYIRNYEGNIVRPVQPLSEQPAFISLGSYKEETNSVTKIATTGNPQPLRIRPLFLKSTLGNSSPGVPGK